MAASMRAMSPSWADGCDSPAGVARVHEPCVRWLLSNHRRSQNGWDRCGGLGADGEAHAVGLRLEAAGDLVGEGEHEVGLGLAVERPARRPG